MLKDFARMLMTHGEGIQARYDYPISTGPLEGTNNKIKTLNRQPYGLRDGDFFTLKLYYSDEPKTEKQPRFLRNVRGRDSAPSLL